MFIALEEKRGEATLTATATAAAPDGADDAISEVKQIHNMLIYELVNKSLIQMLPSPDKSKRTAGTGTGTLSSPPLSSESWTPGETGQLASIIPTQKLTTAELVAKLILMICSQENALSRELLQRPAHSHFALPGVSEEEYAIDAIARRCVLANTKDDKSDSSWSVQHEVQTSQVTVGVADAILDDLMADTVSEVQRVLGARKTVPMNVEGRVGGERSEAVEGGEDAAEVLSPAEVKMEKAAAVDEEAKATAPSPGSKKKKKKKKKKR